MIFAVVALSIAGFGFAGTAIALAIRQAGLREDKVLIEAELAIAHGNLDAAIDELTLTRERARSELAIYRRQLAELREAINALPDNPGNRRIVLDDLDELLSGEETEDTHDNGG